MNTAAITIALLMGGTLLVTSADTRPDVAALLADDNVEQRIRALVPFIANLSPEEIPSAVKQAEEGYGPGRENLLGALAGRWVEVDPEAALDYARHDEFRDTPGAIFGAYYSAWSRRDLAGAIAALAQLPQGYERANAANALATLLAGRDPAQAHALMRSVQTTRLVGIDYLIYWHWARKDLAAVTQMLMQESGYGQNRPGGYLGEAIVDSLLDEDPQTAVKWGGALPEGRLQDTAFNHLAETWGRLDPLAAVSWLKTLSASDRNRNALSKLSSGSEYSSKEAPITPGPAFAAKAAEFAAIREEPILWRRYQRLIAFVDSLTPAEFPFVLEQIRRSPPFDGEDEIDLLMAKWTRADLSGAIAAIPQERGFYDRILGERMQTGLFAGWARQEPDVAFAYARQMPRGYGHSRMLETILEALARKNPPQAYAAFKALNDPNSHLLVRPIFVEWAAADLLAATKALAEEKHYQGAVEGIVMGLLRQGLPAAAEWAHQLEDPKFRDQALWSIALRAEDAGQALAWLEKEPEFARKDDARDSLAVAWANRNSLSALRQATQVPEAKGRSSFMRYGLMTYTYDDALRAVAWCKGLPDGEEKNRSLWIVFATWAGRDPQSAAKYLSSNPSLAMPKVLEAVAGSWSQVDPERAAQWLLGFPNQESKTPAIGKIAEEWYLGDPELAARWVKELPGRAAYDAGAKGICVALRGDLPLSLKWARSIGYAQIRHDAVYSAYENGTNFRGDYFGSPEIKDEIQNEPELTDNEKMKLLARFPSFQILPVPESVTKPTLPSPSQE